MPITRPAKSIKDISFSVLDLDWQVRDEWFDWCKQLPVSSNFVGRELNKRVL
jgi:hypothetical protein